MCRLIPSFRASQWYPFSFFISIFALTIWTNYLIAREINNCFIKYRKVRNDILLFLMLLFSELISIWIVPMCSSTYGFLEWDSFICQIIFISCLGGSIVLLLTFSTIYFKLNHIRTTKNVWLGALSIIIVSILFIAMYYFVASKCWFVLLMLLIIPVFNDSFAYLGGMVLGKHKMAPYLSPKKTWEGLIIGMVIALMLCIALMIVLFLENDATMDNYELLGSFVGWQWLTVDTQETFIQIVNRWWWIVLSLGVLLILSITSTLGDLLFSYFKRMNQIKDYSNLIPGHGGILDRIDSFALVTMVYFVISIIVCLCTHHLHDNSFLLNPFNIH
jgi:phosphatidate cytidylyltransferase